VTAAVISPQAIINSVSMVRSRQVRLSTAFQHLHSPRTS
jgi:hypothetical protein